MESSVETNMMIGSPILTLSGQITEYVREATRGVPRTEVRAYLLRRWYQARKRRNTLEASVLYAYLSSTATPKPQLRAPFNFNALSDRDCVLRFRFHKTELAELLVALAIGDVRTRERTCATGMEAFCVVLYKLAAPVRWYDMETVFGRSSSGLSNIFLHVMSELERRHQQLLYFNRNYVGERLQEFSDAIFDAGGLLPNVWSFVDGTVRGICRPVPRNKRRDGRFLSQQSVYNGHKRKHV